MNLTEYQEAVNKTWLSAEGITELEHCFAGIIEEVGEITGWHKKRLFYGASMESTRTQLKGEFGDLLYYIVKLGELTNQMGNVEYYFEPTALTEESELTSVGVLIGMTGNVYKITQSGLYSDTFRYEYEELIEGLSCLLRREGHSLEDIMESNVAKLKVRHGEAFDTAKSLPADRDILKEDKAVACDTAVQLGLDLQVKPVFLPEKLNLLEIGARVRLSRMMEKLKQYELADKIGVSQCTLSTIETGKYEYNGYLMAYLGVIAKQLDVTMEYLLTGKDA